MDGCRAVNSLVGAAVFKGGEGRGGGNTIISSYERFAKIRVQELCESRGGRPGLSVLTSLLVSVDVKQY